MKIIEFTINGKFGTAKLECGHSITGIKVTPPIFNLRCPTCDKNFFIYKGLDTNEYVKAHGNMDRINPFQIEYEPDYLLWLAEIQSRYPRAKGNRLLRAGASTVGRIHIIASPESDGSLLLGVQLSTGDVFSKGYPYEAFDNLVAQEVRGGHITLPTDTGGFNFIRTEKMFDKWIAEHGKPIKLEIYSSHVGCGCTAIMADGTRKQVDES